MTLGRLAYEAYVEAFPGPASDVARERMPWEKVPPAVQFCWEAAARAVTQGRPAAPDTEVA